MIVEADSNYNENPLNKAQIFKVQDGTDAILENTFLATVGIFDPPRHLMHLHGNVTDADATMYYQGRRLIVLTIVAIVSRQLLSNYIITHASKHSSAPRYYVGAMSITQE